MRITKEKSWSIQAPFYGTSARPTFILDRFIDSLLIMCLTITPFRRSPITPDWAVMFIVALRHLALRPQVMKSYERRRCSYFIMDAASMQERAVKFPFGGTHTILLHSSAQHRIRSPSCRNAKGCDGRGTIWTLQAVARIFERYPPLPQPHSWFQSSPIQSHDRSYRNRSRCFAISICLCIQAVIKSDKVNMLLPQQTQGPCITQSFTLDVSPQKRQLFSAHHLMEAPAGVGQNYGPPLISNQRPWSCWTLETV